MESGHHQDTVPSQQPKMRTAALRKTDFPLPTEAKRMSCR